MKPRHLIPVLALITAACTIAQQPQDNSLKTEFHPPLVSKHWNVEHLAQRDGSKVCAISSGYNGITVLLGNRQGSEDVLVQSNRRMEPGAELSVNAGGGSFQTYEDYFPTKTSHEVLEHLAKGDKVYLEWSELSGPVGRERMRVQNIVSLDNFGARLKECRDSLSLH